VLVGEHQPASELSSHLLAKLVAVASLRDADSSAKPVGNNTQRQWIRRFTDCQAHFVQWWPLLTGLASLIGDARQPVRAEQTASHTFAHTCACTACFLRSECVIECRASYGFEALLHAVYSPAFLSTVVVVNR
jgi:hypothetical protein